MYRHLAGQIVYALQEATHTIALVNQHLKEIHHNVNENVLQAMIVYQIKLALTISVKTPALDLVGSTRNVLYVCIALCAHVKMVIPVTRSRFAMLCHHQLKKWIHVIPPPVELTPYAKFQETVLEDVFVKMVISAIHTRLVRLSV